MAELIPNKLTITQAQREELIKLADEQMPGEACGVIGGEYGKAKQIFPIRNISGNPFRYTMDPEGQVAAFFKIDELGLEIAAMFHSHPHSVPVPSSTDIHESNYPDIPHIIIGKEDGEWALRAYLINNQDYTQLDLDTIPNQQPIE
jgi:proteasome lid subunit RPN8/RPN11